MLYISFPVYPGAHRHSGLGYDYYVSGVKKSWQEAREDCLSRGFSLVWVESEAENDYVNSLMKGWGE